MSFRSRLPIARVAILLATILAVSLPIAVPAARAASGAALADSAAAARAAWREARGALARGDTTAAAALAARAPLEASAVAFAFPPADSTFWPEGIAAAPRTHRFFVASVRHRKVAVVTEGGPPRDFVTPAEADLPAALAVAVDETRRLLWVTGAGLPAMDGYTTADSGRGAVYAFDLETGRLRHRHELPPAPEGHVPGDALVAPDGTVYVSDSAHPVVYRVRGDSLEAFATDPAFRSLQGQALSTDGGTLYVADYSHGIAAVDIATREVRCHSAAHRPNPAHAGRLTLATRPARQGDGHRLGRGARPPSFDRGRADGGRRDRERVRLRGEQPVGEAR